MLLRISSLPTISTTIVGTSVMARSRATSLARNRAKGNPRRRSTKSLTMLRASTKTSARSTVRSAADSAYRTNSVRNSGEKLSVRVASARIPASAAARTAMPARMSRVLSRNGRLGGGGSGTGPLDRLGAMDVTVAGISLFSSSAFSSQPSAFSFQVSAFRSAIGRAAEQRRSHYSLIFSKSLSSFMNSPMSRKCRYTDAKRT